MGVNRRKFLTVAGAGVVAAALDVGGLVSPVLSAPAFADTPGGGGVRGLFGGATTLDQTVVKGPAGALGYVPVGSGDIEKLLLDIQGFWAGSPPIAEAGMLVDRPTSAAAAIVRTAARHSRLRTRSSWYRAGSAPSGPRVRRGTRE